MGSNGTFDRLPAGPRVAYWLAVLTQTILLLHILAGVIALGTAGLAVDSAKGGRLHRRSGNAYRLAMVVVGLTALVLPSSGSTAFMTSPAPERRAASA